MKLLVTGATGLIGKQLITRMLAEGHEVVILTRRPDNVPIVSRLVAFGWNPEKEHPPREAWQGVDAVVHLAGEPVAASRWTQEQKRRIRDSRVIGTRNLVEAIGRLTNRPRVLVSGSAVGIYGNRGEEILSEESKPGMGFLVDICREWEDEAGRAAEFGLRVAQIRIGVVLSPEGGALKEMLLPFKLGLGGKLSTGKQWFPWIHIDDIVGILRHSLITPEIVGPVNGVAPGSITNEVFTKALAAELHRPVGFPVPEFALRILMGEMAGVVLASQHVIPHVAEGSGYRFAFPQIVEALSALLNQASGKDRHAWAG